MAPPRTSGLRVVRKKRPDGSSIDYFYDRKTGKPLGHDREAALARVADDRAAETIDPNSVAALITRYLARPEFKTKLAPRTQQLYRGYLNEMRARYGDLPFRSFGPEAIEDIKAAFGARPRKANQILDLFRILLGYAVKLRLMRENPALRPEMLATPPRTAVWLYADEDAFVAKAGTVLSLAFMLLLYTVQRPSDVLAMTTARIRERDGRLFITLRQEKTGALLELPMHARLEPLVRDRLSRRVTHATKETGEVETTLLVHSPTGLPWAYRNFSRAWDKAAADAGISGRQRRDLRRTGVVRLAEAGATVPQIASLTGWGVDYCQRIVDTYLPRRTEVAIGAMQLWEAAPVQDARIVQLGLVRRRK